MDHNYEARFAAIGVEEDLIKDVKSILLEEKDKNDPNHEGDVHVTDSGHMIVAYKTAIEEDGLEAYANKVMEKIWHKTRKNVDMTISFVNLDDPAFLRYHFNIENHDYYGAILDSIREGATKHFTFHEEQFNKFFDTHLK